MLLLPNSIKLIIDRPVEKMHLKELKEILLRKKVSLWAGEGSICCKVSNPLFQMIKYTLENFNAPLPFVLFFFLSK